MHKLKKFFKKWFDIGYIVKNIILMLIFAVVLLGFTYVIFNLNLGNDSEYIKIVITGIFAICASALAGFATHEDNNRQIALHYITDKRANWLNEQSKVTAELCKDINEYISNYSLVVGSIVSQNNYQCLNKTYCNAIKNIAQLSLRYNFTGGRDKYILGLLRLMQETLFAWNGRLKPFNLLDFDNFQDEKKKFYNCLNLLVLHSQIYSKLEWERSKDEAKYIGNMMMRGKLIKKLMIHKRLHLYKKQVIFRREMDNINIKDLDIEEAYRELLKEKQKI